MKIFAEGYNPNHNIIPIKQPEIKNEVMILESSYLKLSLNVIFVNDNKLSITTLERSSQTDNRLQVGIGTGPCRKVYPERPACTA